MFNLHVDEDAWQLRAECYKRRDEVKEINQSLGYDMFYPETGKGGEALKWSKLFCNNCDVKVRCFSEGLYEKGTWGGATEKERRRLVPLRNMSLSALAERLGVQLQDENKLPNEESNRGPSPS